MICIWFPQCLNCCRFTVNSHPISQRFVTACLERSKNYVIQQLHLVGYERMKSHHHQTTILGFLYHYIAYLTLMVIRKRGRGCSGDSLDCVMKKSNYWRKIWLFDQPHRLPVPLEPSRIPIDMWGWKWILGNSKADGSTCDIFLSSIKCLKHHLCRNFFTCLIYIVNSWSIKLKAW